MSALAMRSQTTAAGPRVQHIERRAAPSPAYHSQTGLCVQRESPAARVRRAGSVLQQRPLPAAAAAGAAPPAGSSTQRKGNESFAAHSQLQRKGDEYFATSDRRPIILFDGVCNLCNGGVNFMLVWDKEGCFRFAALQSPAGQALLERSGRRPDDISSIVLVERGGSYIKSAAILRIAAGLQMPLPLVAAALDVFPRPFKDGVYDQVANNRYNLFGRTQTCRLSDARFDERFVS